MGRLTAFVVSTLISVVVFIALARPLLLELLGPEALLLAYAGAAVATGTTVYVLLRNASLALASRRDPPSEHPDTDQQIAGQLEDDLVEQELKQLDSDR
ncbi:hypothetical protein [Haloarcula nitratireducens]|uniref:Uncharacterized protein n=1 Tax=Haloarcula nitratireducens TaxID=2487749 RepID=A0AAW4PJV0_9EURY|nr:hypothetical protein [Halomicroarcula nitratireducens]MBX0298249.1 hypothetical protein [Halomicroarcula nitratireducens]